jgi:hypothetical protein
MEKKYQTAWNSKQLDLGAYTVFPAYRSFFHSRMKRAPEADSSPALKVASVSAVSAVPGRSQGEKFHIGNVSKSFL